MTPARNSAPASGLLRLLGHEAPALALDGVRVGCALVFLAYFAQGATETLPLLSRGLLADGVAVSSSLCALAFGLGLTAALGLALGFGARACALVLFACCVWLRSRLGAARDLDDDMLRLLAFFLALLPIGRTLQPGPLLRADSNALRSWRALFVPGLSVRLLLLSLWLFSARSSFEWGALGFGIPVYAVLPALPLLALCKRVAGLRWLALCAHVALLALCVRDTGSPYIGAVLLLTAPLFHLRFEPRRSGAPALDLGAAVALLALCAGLSVAMESVIPGPALGPRAAALLDRAGLTLTTFANPRERSAIGLFDAAGKPVSLRGLPKDNHRARLLLHWLAQPATNEPRVQDRACGRQRLRRALARAACATQVGGPARLSLRLGAQVATRFECAAGEPRMLTRDAGEPRLPDAHELATAETGRMPMLPDPRDYAGPESCKRCHAEAYAHWSVSAHAKSSGDASPSNVHAKADGPLVHDALGYAMRVGDRSERVALVIGAGRREQAYLALDASGRYVLLPELWSSSLGRFLEAATFYPDAHPHVRTGGIDHAPALRDALELGCLGCHAGQASVSVGDRDAGTHFVAPAVDCESCHGPRAAHATQRERGLVEESAPVANAAASCPQCHSGHLARRAATDATAVGFVDATLGLEDAALRADGSPQLPNRQGEAFALSRCHNVGKAECSSCHSAHDGTLAASRAVAEGDPNGVCTQCHAQVAVALTEHSHHAATVRCVDCHMPRRFALDDPHSGRLQTDHGISAPRPKEALLLGQQSACTRCHADRDEGWALAALRNFNQDAAIDTRSFIEPIAAAKAGRRDQALALARLLAIEDRGSSLPLAVLRLLAAQAPEPTIAPELAAFAAHREPELRAAGLAALSVHDPSRARELRERACRDPHPFVSSQGFALRAAAGELDELDLRRRARDALQFCAGSCIAELLVLSQLREAMDEPDEALELVRLAQRYASVSQRTSYAIDTQAARLESELTADECASRRTTPQSSSRTLPPASGRRR